MTAPAVVLVPISGQSLSIGSHGTPPIDLVGEYPTHVVRTEHSGSSNTKFYPCGYDIFEAENRQVPGVSLGYRLHEWMQVHRYRGHQQPVAVCTYGRGGTTIVSLSEGGIGTYETLMVKVDDHVTFAGRRSRSVECPAFIWVQGESDYVTDTSRAAYLVALEAYQANAEGDIQAKLGRASAIPLICTQTSSWSAPGVAKSSPTIGLAQLDAHDANPGVIIVACPQYPFGYDTDEIHLLPASYYHLGEVLARVLIAVMKGETWEPLRPLSAAFTSTTQGVCQFNVPVEPLVFDTTTVAAQTNQGFTYTDDAGRTLSSVALGADGTSVEFTISGAAGGNPRLRYGFQNQYGNLADSEAQVSEHDGARLRNWCVHFEQSVTA